MKPYMTRTGGATVTVFVPYDCENHCPFCINKAEYANAEHFSLEKILESIRTLDAITPNCDFVFTGGEPLANLDSLQKMIDCIPSTHRIFINTTLPLMHKNTPQDLLDFFSRNQQKITCVNCSRHLVPYVEESPDSFLAQLPVPRRVNCVLFDNYPAEQLVDYVERFYPYQIPVQFRYDYTDTTLENLYETDHDKIFQDLNRTFRYTGLDGCRMRNGYHFDYKGLELTYHKTLPYSTLPLTQDGVTYDVLYDIIIKQTGEIHSDWTGVKLDVEAYRNVRFEPYDLRWIETIS